MVGRPPNKENYSNRFECHLNEHYIEIANRIKSSVGWTSWIKSQLDNYNKGSIPLEIPKLKELELEAEEKKEYVNSELETLRNKIKELEAEAQIKQEKEEKRAQEENRYKYLSDEVRIRTLKGTMMDFFIVSPEEAINLTNEFVNLKEKLTLNEFLKRKGINMKPLEAEAQINENKTEI